MSKDQQSSLIFVYNADSGLFNTMADIAHKMLSPNTYTCSLCALTHGVFTEKEQWREFIEQLGIAVEFLHRDEFERRYAKTLSGYPVVLERHGMDIDTLLQTSEINRCRSVDDLCRLIEKAVRKPD